MMKGGRTGGVGEGMISVWGGEAELSPQGAQIL